jgi:biotin synthase
VNWPEAGGEGFWRGLARAVSDGQIRRVCFQLTVAPGAFEEARGAVREVRRRLPGVPVCVSAACRSLAGVEHILGWGADRVTLALDVANPAAYREVKGGSLDRCLDLIARAAGRFPGRIGTHLIAGLGETEEEMVRLFQVMADLDVSLALFAFTPVEGTDLEGREPPDLRSYRRLQAARHLVVTGLVRAGDMVFDSRGRLRSYGLPWERVREVLADGEAFRTSGCPDCNRPYYNERPSGKLFNYPRPLSEGERTLALEEARPAGEEGGTGSGSAVSAAGKAGRREGPS